MADGYGSFRAFFNSDEFGLNPAVPSRGTANVVYEDHTFSNGIKTDAVLNILPAVDYIGQDDSSNFWVNLFKKQNYIDWSTSDSSDTIPNVYLIVTPTKPDSSELVLSGNNNENGFFNFKPISSVVRVIANDYPSLPENVKSSWHTNGSIVPYDSTTKCYTESCYLITYKGGSTPVTKYTITENLTHMTSDADSELEENTQFTFNFRSEPGYIIDSLTSNIGTVTIAEDKQTATITGTITQNMTITGVAIPEPVYYTVTENLTHVFHSSTNPETVKENENFVLNYIAETGYKIQTLTCNIGSVVFNSDNTSATVSGTATENIVVTGTGVYEPKTYNVVSDIDSNIIADSSNPATVTEGSSVTFKYSAKSGYKIARCTSNYGTAEIAEDKHTATVKITSVSGTVRIVVTSVEEIIPKLVITGTFENCTCNYTNGEVISKEKNVIITANSGYEFKNEYTYLDNTYSYNLTKNLEKTALTIDTTAITGLSDITLNDNYVATVPVETIGGFCNLYKVTEKQLSQLAKVRFVKDSTSDTVVDYGSSITQLYILPLALPDDIIGDTSNIILGSYDSKVESTLLNTYTVDYDMGEIAVPAKYNNAYDFINTTCTLRVPFFNAVALDPENVIGHTISIKYTLDLYSGNVTMNVTSDFTGSIVYSATQNIVTQIPFIQKQNNSVVNQLSNVFKYLVTTPVIEVVRNIPYTPDNNTFGRSTVIVDKISSVIGYCEVENVELITLATDDEKDQIKQLLKDGVFINE